MYIWGLISYKTARWSNHPEAVKVRDWRHKLQKTFLSNKGLPSEEVRSSISPSLLFLEWFISQDMPTLDNLFTTIETYDQMNIQYLSVRLFPQNLETVLAYRGYWSQSSKIGKVMRHIAALAADKVPKDNEFKFRDRAKVLVDKWHQILSSNKPNGADVAANGAKDDADHEAIAALDLNGNVDREHNNLIFDNGSFSMASAPG